MAIIADEVFLDFRLAAKRPPSFAANTECAHVHDERPFQIVRPAADESVMVHYRRPGAIEISGARTHGSNRRHLSFDEYSRTACDSRFSQAAAWLPEAGDESGAHRICVSWIVNSPDKNSAPVGSRRRLERGAARPGDSFGRRCCDQIARRKECLPPPGAFLRLPGRWIHGGQLDHAGTDICGRN